MTPASAEPRPLEAFEGHDVIGAKVAITRAGDGLSDALSVEPVAYDQGAKIYVVLECLVDKVQFDPVKDTDSLVRKHTFAAQAATIVDAELVAGLVDSQKELIRKRKEEAAGIQSIPFDQPAENPAIELLNQLKKDDLKKIATANGVTFKAKATSTDLIELLVDQVVGIYDVAEAAVQHLRDDADEGTEASVTPIGQAAKAVESDEWED